MRAIPTYDLADLRKLAERYRKLARKFEHVAIRDRLHALADDLEEQMRELRTPAHELGHDTLN